MKIWTMAAAAALACFGTTGFAETYVLDQGHTEVRFQWNHAGLTTQSGEWTRLAGTIEFDPDDVAATSANVTIDATSLHTGFPELDTLLQGPDFFDAEAYPEITFVSTSAVQTGAKTMRLSGGITVKGQTVPAVLDVKMTFSGEHPLGGYFDYYQGQWIGVEATGTVLRSDLGVGLYAPLTSDAVQLGISAEMRAGGWPE